MKKITQKKSNLKLLVESIAEGMVGNGKANGTINETRADDNRSIDERVNSIARDIDDIKTSGNDYMRDVFGAIIRNIDVTHDFDILYRNAMDGEAKAKDDFYYIINPLEVEKYDFGRYSGFRGATKPEFVRRIFKYLDFFNGNMDREECDEYVKKARDFNIDKHVDKNYDPENERYGVSEATKPTAGYVHVTCMNPDPNGPEKLEFDVPDSKLEDWMKKWNVNATYQELQTRMIESDTAELQSGGVMYFYLNQP